MAYSFFVNRPVLSSVISIIIVAVGLIALKALPIAQYPTLAPPTVSVSAAYPGASAQTVAQTVAVPLEQKLNGIENLLYMSSTSNAQGGMNITLHFATGTDIDKAAMEISDRLQRVAPSLPQEVQRSGLSVSKRSSDILGIISLRSINERYDRAYVGNYALLNIVDELKRVKGVGEAQIMGGIDYAMRIWLQPSKLALYKLTPSDVIAQIREQNAQYSVGHFGEAPDKDMGAYTYSAITKGRLSSVKEFQNIILRSNANGGTLKLQDVARVELGSEQYMVNTKLNGQPMVPVMVNLQSGANALETMQLVKARMLELQKTFPEGIVYSIPYDTTDFIKVSINEVIHTFIEALILVVLVVYLFLQNWRATLIPVIAVPISIIGTFAGMYAFGFSLNLLTLFGLVLAIGIVVDDAIIVLENVERLMRTEGLSPREAAIKSMAEVMAPVIAIVLVLCAVFIPVAFIGGMAGTMYKQFAVTIAISVVTSGVVALTLTPVLCMLLLTPAHQSRSNFFHSFNLYFEKAANRYSRGAAYLISYKKLGISLFMGVCLAGFLLYKLVPSALVPMEDQGSLMAFVMLPPGASINRTLKVMDQAQKIYTKNPAVENVVSISGLDLFSGGLKSSAGAFFISLKDWTKRAGHKEQDARNLPASFMQQTSSIEDGFVMTLNPPPVQGLSTTGGVELYLQSRGNNSIEDLYAAAQKFIAATSALPSVASARTTFNPNVPQYRIIVNRSKAIAMGVPINSIYETMSATFGNVYVNDFTMFGRNYKVQLQSDAPFRRTPNDLSKVFVKSKNGKMIPLDSLVSSERIVASDQLVRFNGFYAMNIMVQPKPSYATGDVMQSLENLAKTTLSQDYHIAWSGSSYQERQSGNASFIAVAAGILMVFLILAAQYERWSLPIVVVSALPFAMTGALLFTWLRGLSNDIYFQIGLITLIGLAAKNAILIVEFAMIEHRNGKSLVESAINAARLRFRPIIMTSVVFILGTIPLAVSSGAGAESRHSISTGIIGGMIFATGIAIFFVPLCYCLVGSLTSRKVSKQ